MEIVGYINGEHCTFTSLKERLAVQNADKIAELNKLIDLMALDAATDDMGWRSKRICLACDSYGKFEFSVIPDRAFSIDYSNYYSVHRKNSGRYPWRSETKPTIKKVIFNPPATIVFWNDGTKTVVKAQNEAFDWEKGLAMAICKKYLSGNKGGYYNVFREYENAGIEAEYKEAIKSLATRMS